MKKTKSIGLSLIGLGLIASAPVQHSAKRTATASGPVLWHGVRAGMTEQQLRAALPGVERGEKDGTFTAPDTKADYSTMKVAIYMEGGHVTSVVLTGGFGDALAKSLTEKYGEPFAPFDCHWLGGARSCQGSWKVPGGAKASLVQFDGTGGGFTKLTYEVSGSAGL